MDHKALETVNHYRMIQQGGSVLVGLSGGADSMALLDFLCSLRESWGINVAACHVNHGLRGAESDRDACFVDEMCRRYHVELFTFTEDIAAFASFSGLGIEEAAREKRYVRFREAAAFIGPETKIATAHTLSDNMETVLFRLARGTGLKGLSGIPPVRGDIIRPLIGVTRLEVEAYCARRGLAFVTDSSNLSDAYARNRIRHYVAPEMYRINPAADAAFSRLIEIVRSTDAFMEQQAGILLKRICMPEGIPVCELRRVHPALARAAVAQWLGASGAKATYERVERIIRAAAQNRREVQAIGNGITACIGNEYIRLAMDQPPINVNQYGEHAVICAGESVVIAGKKVEIVREKYEQYKKIENNTKIHLKNILDYDKIERNICIRTRLEGDRFSMPGRNWTKTLKKLFNEYGVALEERGRRIVCADSDGVFWVEGFGPDKRVAPDGATEQILVINISEELT